MNRLTAIPVDIHWHSDLPIFACESFLQAVGDEYGWIGGVDDSGHLRCILPYTVLTKAGFRAVRFRVETIPLEERFDETEERLFLGKALEFFRATGADMIVPPSNTALFRTYPEKAAAAPYSTFINDLELPEEMLWHGVSEAYRKDIRRALRAGVTIEQGMQYLDAAHQLTADTLSRSGAKLKASKDFLKTIHAFGDNVRVCAAFHEGVMQACLVIPFSAHTAYTLYGGTVPQPVKGSMQLLHWEAIRTFRELGVKRFNFTGARTDPEKGSKQEGIMTFKQRFGGRLVRGYMWKYGFSRIKFAAYSAVVRMTMGGDVVDLERHKLASQP